MSDGFHMLQLRLENRRLIELGKMLRLPLRHVDTGYLVHCALGELFQEQTPRPFDIEGGAGADRYVRVLAYSSVPLDALHELARGFASPQLYATCDWQGSADKPMPTQIPNGMRLGFELRACPVVRLASARKHYREGAELDVFLAECAKVDDDVELDRGEVYLSWLGQQLERSEAADLERAEVTRFSLEKLLRRTGGGARKARPVTRPDVTFEGELTVIDGGRFLEVVRRGVGRHRGFGFGMLKIRRATRGR